MTPRDRSLSPASILLLVLTVVLMTACPPTRDRGGSRTGSSSDAEAGVFSWYSYGYGYQIGRLLVTRDAGDTCDTNGYYDEDYDYLSASLYRGDSVDWEGEYFSIYDEGGPCYGLYGSDMSSIHCFGSVIDCRGEDGGCSSGYDSTLRITSFGNSRVSGSATVEGRTTSFSVLNCGVLDEYEARSTIPEEEPPADPPTSARIESAWGLRFR
jgi:hypothetical protein